MLRLLTILALAACTACHAGEKRTERWYQERAASILGGKMEAPVENGRVDILTATHAVEVEFAAKWKNSIGQSLWYALQTNRRAAVILIIEDAKRDRAHAIRLGSVIQANNLPVDLWLWPDDFGG